jgi:drug/metabolite transporter (DMT)-like permease
MNSSPSSVNRRSCALPLAYAFIYFAWGATYLGVKLAIVDIPVFLMSGARFFLAGILLLAAIALFDRRGFRRGALREWKDAGIIGFLLLAFGIGAGNWTQQYLASSFVAMVFSALPLWIILIDWLRPGGRAPSRTVALGLLMGFIGIGVILVPAGHDSAGAANLGLNLLLVLASISWAGGAILSKHVPVARGSVLLPVARQMIIGGALLLLTGLFHGDLAHLHLAQVHLTAWLGFIYLVVVGSLGGYSIYIWLMRVAPPAKAATIPYVNLLVAVFLGWFLGHETITLRLLIGTAIVVTSVALVLREKPEEAMPTSD